MKNIFSDFINRRPALVLSLLILTVSLICLWNFFSLDDMFIFTGLASDSYTSYLPNWVAGGRLNGSPYNFYDGAGNSSVGYAMYDPLSMFSYVFSLLFSWLFGLGMSGMSLSVAHYFYSKFFFSILGTGIFTFFWLRMLNVNKFSAIFGGILAAFSSSIIVLAPWNLDTFGFYTALYLFAFEKLFQQKNPIWFIIAAVAFATQPYFLYLHSFFLAVYMVFRFAVVKADFKRIFKTCLWVFLAGVLALLICLPQIIAVLDVQLNTPRMEDVAYGKSASSNIFLSAEMYAVTILRLLANNIPGNDFGFSEWDNYLEAPAIYSGLITLLIFPQIFQFLSRRKQLAYAGLLLFWIAVILFPPLRRSIVLYAGDYYRYGIDFFFTFTMILVSAQSLSLIIAKKYINFPLLIGTLLFFALLVWGVCTGAESFMVQKTEILFFCAIVAVVYVLLFCFINYINRQTLKTLILLLVLFEVTVLTYSAFDGRATVSFTDLELNLAGYDDGIGEVLDDMRKNDTTKFYRTEVSYTPGIAIHSSLNCNKILDYFTTRVYNSFNQPEYVKFLRSICAVSPYLETDTRWIRGIPQMPFIYAFMSSKYLIIRQQDSANTTPTMFMLADTVKKFKKHLLLKNGYVMPIGFALDKYISRENFDSLVTFSVTHQTANFVIENLQRNGYPQDALIVYVNGVRDMVGRSFASLKEIDEYVNEHFQGGIARVISSYIYTICHENAKQLYSLLNCFVPSDEEIDLSKYTELSPNSPELSIDALSLEDFKKDMKLKHEESLNLTEFKHYYMKGNINLKSDKFMVLTIPYDAAWTVKVDGMASQIKKCDVGFCGVELSSGSHIVELEYVPQNRTMLIVIARISVAVFWLLIVFYIVKKYGSTIKNKIRERKLF
ncbi:MAG: YfhO family protein [Bacteroidales bacterium]|nr:YfhO family protein [Bacteroidales bacterium]